MSDDLLKAGVRAFRSGDKREARRLFGQLINHDPDNAAGWWYLASVVDDASQKVHCLRQVLRLHPDHEEAAQQLAALQPRVARPTPSTGSNRPLIHDAQDVGDGLAVIPTEDDSLEPTPDDVGIALAAVLIALVAIIATVVLVLAGGADNVLGFSGPKPEPTLRQLIFDVKACAATDDGTTTLTFINNTGVVIDVLRGPQGDEELLLTLEPGAQDMVEVSRPGVSVRYSATADAEGITGGGAIVEVPDGYACRVPIK